MHIGLVDKKSDYNYKIWYSSELYLFSAGARILWIYQLYLYSTWNRHKASCTQSLIYSSLIYILSPIRLYFDNIPVLCLWLPSIPQCCLSVTRVEVADFGLLRDNRWRKLEVLLLLLLIFGLCVCLLRKNWLNIFYFLQ